MVAISSLGDAMDDLVAQETKTVQAQRLWVAVGGIAAVTIALSAVYSAFFKKTDCRR